MTEITFIQVDPDEHFVIDGPGTSDTLDMLRLLAEWASTDAMPGFLAYLERQHGVEHPGCTHEISAERVKADLAWFVHRVRQADQEES